MRFKYIFTIPKSNDYSVAKVKWGSKNWQSNIKLKNVTYQIIVHLNFRNFQSPDYFIIFNKCSFLINENNSYSVTREFKFIKMLFIKSKAIFTIIKNKKFEAKKVLVVLKMLR